MIDLGLLFLIVWMLKNAAVDVSCAIKGTENPRYALKRQKALAAGKTPSKQPRYGSRDWFGDLVSDGLAAQTERRRAKVAEKAKAAKKDDRPLDDLAEAVREEPRTPVAPATVRTDEFPNFVAGEAPTPERKTNSYPSLVKRVIVPEPDWNATHYRVPSETAPKTKVSKDEPVDSEQATTYRFTSDDLRGFEPLTVTCTRDDLEHHIRNHLDPGGNWDFYVEVSEDGRTAAIRNHGKNPHGTVRITRTDEPTDTRPDAVVIPLFPNPKKIEKEIRMATSEVTGLSTALAFAQTAADAHASFATGGTEGYTGALAQHGVGEGCIGSAREAQEASSIAAAKWAKHHEDLTAQLNVKQAYQGTPDAGDKQFLLNG